MMIPVGMGATSSSQLPAGYFTAPQDPLCTGASYYLDPLCWGYETAAAAGVGPLAPGPSGYMNPPAPTPPGAPAPTASNPTPLTTPPASGSDAQATINATVANSAAANQQALLDFYNQQAALTPVTCTENIFPNLGICDSTIYWGVGIAAAALVLFVKLK
jgi:hypothetical protein